MPLPTLTREYTGSGAGTQFKSLYREGIGPNETIAFFGDELVVRILGQLAISTSIVIHPKSIYEKDNRILEDRRHTDYNQPTHPSTRVVVWARPKADLPLIQSIFHYDKEQFLGLHDTAIFLLGKKALKAYFKQVNFSD